MTTRKSHIHLGPGLTLRERAIDPVYRFVEALDTQDEDLIRSAFATDGIIDLSRLRAASNREYEERKGIEAIVKTVFAHVGPMDSAHHVSNVRVKLQENLKEAEVTAYALAQHFRPGEGSNPAKKESMLMGNRYWAHVTRDGDDDDALWKIKRIELSNLWTAGDPSIIA